MDCIFRVWDGAKSDTVFLYYIYYMYELIGYPL